MLTMTNGQRDNFNRFIEWIINGEIWCAVSYTCVYVCVCMCMRVVCDVCTSMCMHVCMCVVCDVCTNVCMHVYVCVWSGV